VSTLKQIRKYARKGIFTVNQLSYLYRPRKQRKRSRTPPKLRHSPELQALVLRTGKVYLHETPLILKQATELFLDIEGNSDTQRFYLIGLLRCEAQTAIHHSFWANTAEEEGEMWLKFITMLEKNPTSPIYHYGSFDSKAIAVLGRGYQTAIQGIAARMVNLNNFIYAKVYFPVYTNGLKQIGEFLGAKWTYPDASGLQAIIWRLTPLSRPQNWKNKVDTSALNISSQ
jgi:predicted RecB family nuclease